MTLQQLNSNSIVRNHNYISSSAKWSKNNGGERGPICTANITHDYII